MNFYYIFVESNSILFISEILTAFYKYTEKEFLRTAYFVWLFLLVILREHMHLA